MPTKQALIIALAFAIMGTGLYFVGLETGKVKQREFDVMNLHEQEPAQPAIGFDQ